MPFRTLTADVLEEPYLIHSALLIVLPVFTLIFFLVWKNGRDTRRVVERQLHKPGLDLLEYLPTPYPSIVEGTSSSGKKRRATGRRSSTSMSSAETSGTYSAFGDSLVFVGGFFQQEDPQGVLAV